MLDLAKAKPIDRAKFTGIAQFQPSCFCRSGGISTYTFPVSKKMIQIPPLHRWALIGTVLMQLFSGMPANASTCQQGVPIVVGDGRSGIEIDNAWSGATVAFDAIARGKLIYFGYYDADRWLTVAQLDPLSGVVCRSRLPSRFAGWDSHNSVALAFDSDGRLQVAANMHVSPLVYGAAASSDSIGDISLSPMIGRDEDRTTYPNFMTSADGRLYFAYRSGMSGNGEWFVNVRDGQSWQRVLNTPIFASTGSGSPTNAYPSAFRVSRDGYFHLAVVWRRAPDLATNYAITYARTRDFVHWTDHNGKPIAPPLDPGNSDMIEATGENEGLLNSARVNVTVAGKPIVTYSRYGEDGKNIVVLASPSGGLWRRSIIATAGRQTVAAGGGTVPSMPSFGDLNVSGSAVGSIDIAFPGEPRKRVFFDIKTLKVVDAPKVQAKSVGSHPPNVSPPPGLANARKNSRGIRVEGKAGGAAGSMIYFSQGINRDQARKCTSSQPNACNPPPSPIIFVP
ncbi:BNR repeat-containing protein [Ensifer adhaerens]|uniref:BNR repeat-containing protein n=1 Tax=Ensifer adhaerens TaxID=106592 RepID=UPI001CBF68DE|nr:BNR repeat-containing protein [Ensifer adhaerens]UAX95104.1 BNR repeat-containing protein [Ensifer adhaerens]UAY03004.1 BNR repeat-containing protein [Ensifer adhaerens]UAY10989.1 BNR repeat-containing protein [Ensifer adhaerens]